MQSDTLRNTIQSTINSILIDSYMNPSAVRHITSSHLVSSDAELYIARASRAAKGVALPIVFQLLPSALAPNPPLFPKLKKNI